MSEMRDAIGVLLAGGQGERLWPLTRDRAKPAVPFGALYRIIDVTLSNCINSDLRKVFVLTQYKALSLNRHVREGWSSLMGLGDYIEVLAPQMRVSNQWYQGTADAVYQNIYSIGSVHSKYVFILSGDHIYKMNYGRMLQQHIDSGAEVTVGVVEIPVEQAAKQFGVIEVDKDYRIRGFEEKPAHPKESPHHAGHCNASMGIYIFNTQRNDSDFAGGFRGSKVGGHGFLAKTFCRGLFQSIACVCFYNFARRTNRKGMRCTGAM